MVQKRSQRRFFISSAATIFGIVILVILAKVKKGHSYEMGAPARICGTMTPSHGEESLSTAMPFDISIDRRFIRGAGEITVKVASKDPSKYSLRGVLFIMKQPNDKQNAFGTFNPKSSEQDLKTLDCFGKPGTGITHSHSKPKTMLTFQWIAPNETSGEYELHATLVRDFNPFWADYIYPHRIRVSVDAPASAGFASLFKPLLLLLLAALIIS